MRWYVEPVSHFVSIIRVHLYNNCIACDYANYKDGHWVPILAILCDGNNFEYFVYDSGNKRVYTSGRVTGIISDEQESTAEFLYPTKKSRLFHYYALRPRDHPAC